VGGAIWLHDNYRMRWWLLISLLLILLGVLMLIARDPRIPERRTGEPSRPASEPPPPSSPTPPSAP
jgi:hypothetical protein